MHRGILTSGALVLSALLAAAPAAASLEVESRADDISSACSVSSSSSATNYWKPQVGDTWQIILSEVVNLNSCAASADSGIGIFDVDVFDTPKAKIQELRNRNKRVICYFSAGSYENWRSDAGDFKDSDLGKPLDGWPGERWVDVRSQNVRDIMTARIQLAADKGCDAVDPDNVDGYQNANGLGLTKEDAVDFMQYLSDSAHSHGLAIGLKNAGNIVNDLVKTVQFSVNEQCVKYSECNKFAPFITNGKPVFHIEYPPGAPDITDAQKKKFCGTTGPAQGAKGFSTDLKKMNLNEWIYECASASNGC